MKLLPGQDLRDGDYAELQRRVDALLWELVYAPVVAVVRPAMPRELRPSLAPRALQDATERELRNQDGDAVGRAALLRALAVGACQMAPDPSDRARVLFFTAKPDRLVSDGLRAFGARLNKRSSAWTCLRVQVPATVAAAARGYEEKARAVHDAVKGTLSEIERRIDQFVDEANLSKGVDHAIGEVAQGWKESARALQLRPTLGPAGEEALAAGFAANARIPIKRWSREAVARLREQVDQNAGAGFRAEGLAERIRSEYGVSKGRAGLIARQETSNFMAKYRAARALDAGLRRYMWQITNDARTRQGHRDINGRIFSYAQKAPAIYMSCGEPCNPGEDFRCVPAGSKLLLAGDMKKAYRRWHEGELAEVVAESGETLRATLNHPILTTVGWKRADALERGDKLIGLRRDALGLAEEDVDHRQFSVEEVFDALAQSAPFRRVSGSIKQFHGDGGVGDVDVVGAAWPLSLWRKTAARQRLEDLLLPLSQETALGESLGDAHLAASLVGDVSSRHLGKVSALLKRETVHALDIGLRSGTRLDAGRQKTHAQPRPGSTQSPRYGEFALAGDILLYCRSVAVIEVRRVKFSGHVFNFETSGGWYAVGEIITHNCRCRDRAVIE